MEEDLKAGDDLIELFQKENIGLFWCLGNKFVLLYWSLCQNFPYSPVFKQYVIHQQQQLAVGWNFTCKDTTQEHFRKKKKRVKQERKKKKKHSNLYRNTTLGDTKSLLVLGAFSTFLYPINLFAIVWPHQSGFRPESHHKLS